MRGFTPNTGFNTSRTYSHQHETEARIKARGAADQTRHSPLPWRMVRDGRNRVWLVDARGVRVHLHAGNAQLILRALEACTPAGS